jgi:hypothetical protein
MTRSTVLAPVGEIDTKTGEKRLVGAWAPDIRHLRRLEVFQMRCLLYIFGIREGTQPSKPVAVSARHASNQQAPLRRSPRPNELHTIPGKVYARPSSRQTLSTDESHHSRPPSRFPPSPRYRRSTLYPQPNPQPRH